MGRTHARFGTALYLALVLLTPFAGGCLLAAAGVAGGAAAGYAYCKGKVCDLYNANFDDTWAATHTALAELGMPVVQEERQAAEGHIESRTADGDRVRIVLGVMPSRIPAEGPLTRVCVRVATFGDHPVSERLLNQVGAHLMPANAAVRPVAAPAGPPAPAVLGPPTTEPPLLPAGK